MTLIAILIRASNALLMIILPIGLGIYWTRRYKLGWRLWWLGGMTFILSQVGHLPFNWLASNLFNTGVLPLPDESWRLIFNALFLGFSAGLWEEGFRLAAYYLWARDTRTWPKAVLLGAGHGGIEAILLGGLVLLTLFQMVALYNADLPGLVPPAGCGRAGFCAAHTHGALGNRLAGPPPETNTLAGISNWLACPDKRGRGVHHGQVGSLRRRRGPGARRLT